MAQPHWEMPNRITITRTVQVAMLVTCRTRPKPVPAQLGSSTITWPEHAIRAFARSAKSDGQWTMTKRLDCSIGRSRLSEAPPSERGCSVQVESLEELLQLSTPGYMHPISHNKSILENRANVKRKQDPQAESFISLRTAVRSSNGLAAVGQV